MNRDEARALPRNSRIVHHVLGPGVWHNVSRIDGPTACWVTFDGAGRRTCVQYTDVDPTTTQEGK